MNLRIFNIASVVAYALFIRFWDFQALHCCQKKMKDRSRWALLLLLSLQSCPTLCDLLEGSPQGSPTPGILQARTLEWVAISFSNAWKWKVNVKSLSHVQPLATQWTAAYQAPPSMGFSRQQYWSRVPLPSPKMGTNICYVYIVYFFKFIKLHLWDMRKL